MLRNDVSYPYPVLRSFISDYKKSFFHSDISVEMLPNGYRLNFDFAVNNERISKLFEDGYLSYGVYVCCPKTMLREMHYPSADEKYIDIPAETVHYRVEYAAYIIAIRDIDQYVDEDFEEGFEGIDFCIPKGAIFGIGDSGSFDATYKNDIIKDAASVIQIKGSETEKYMKVDLDKDTIVVWMPIKQSTMYKNMARTKDTQDLLHAVVTIPVLVEAIGVMAKTGDGVEDEELSERPWFLTIKKAIKDLSEMLGETEQNLYDYPLRTAQIIMKNNSETALRIIQGGF